MKNVAKRQSKAKGKARLTLISQREIERTYLSKVQEILAMIETEKQSLRDSELRTDEPMHLQIGYLADNYQNLADDFNRLWKLLKPANEDKAA